MRNIIKILWLYTQCAHFLPPHCTVPSSMWRKLRSLSFALKGRSSPFQILTSPPPPPPAFGRGGSCVCNKKGSPLITAQSINVGRTIHFKFAHTYTHSTVATPIMRQRDQSDDISAMCRASWSVGDYFPGLLRFFSHSSCPSRPSSQYSTLFLSLSLCVRLIGSKDDRWTKAWRDYMKGHTRTKWRIIKRLFLFFTTLSVIPLTVLYLITSDQLYRFRQYTVSFPGERVGSYAYLNKLPVATNQAKGLFSARMYIDVKFILFYIVSLEI